MTDGISDEELTVRFRSGDKRAGEQILVRYKNKVLAIARRFFLVGGDTEDLVQEGMCGLYSAMTTFEGESGFSSYAHACIKNRILDAVKKSSGVKNFCLACALPFSEEGEGANALNVSPEEQLIGTEAANEFSEKMKDALSGLEYSVVCAYVDGATMNEIAKSLNITYKQTDNALMRAKNKLRKILIK
ncbi:MAG: sigma-70 family RNA polymerase sigma factor [Clostridia bacterium]|nr:sigma-70 family RNA polymerase sigma factor [Clostridia bacterium]